jgi:ribonuclease HII
MSASKKSLLRPDPSLINELKSIYQFGRIVGLDEVGRGALAGPIVVAAIEINVVLPNVCDSKRLSVVSRTELTPLLIANANQVSLGQASNDEIDSIGITQAQELAYARALENITADLFLTDFVRLPKNIEQSEP